MSINYALGMPAGVPVPSPSPPFDATRASSPAATPTNLPATTATTAVPSLPVERPQGTSDTPTTAIIGLIGVVVGALLTQVFSFWRENRQWERHVAHDNERWEQERKERQEQWKREDESRWHKERLAAYSALVASVERWIRLAQRAKPYAFMGKGVISAEDGKPLEAAAEEIGNAAVTAELLAPRYLRGRIHRLYIQTSFFRIDFSGHAKQRTPEEADKDASEYLKTVIKNKNALRDLMRQELGIEIQEAEEEQKS